MSAPVVLAAFYVGAIIVTAVAGYLIYRQNLSSYRVVRDFLLGVYVLIFALMLLELWRVLDGFPSGIYLYAPLSIGLGVIQAILLACAAVGLYLRPVGSSYKTFLTDLRSNRLQSGLLLLFALFSISAIAAVAILRPYTVAYVSAVGGGEVIATIFPAYYVLLIAIVLFFFLCYPTVTLLLATHRIPNKLLGGTVLSLPVGWAGVSTMYVLFEGFLWLYRVDATGLMYFFNAILFLLVTRNFRNAAVLAGLVVPARQTQSIPIKADSTVAGLKAEKLGGLAILLRVQPSSGFEEQIRVIASNLLSLGKTVFVFTSRKSRVDQAVTALPGIKLYLMTPNISYYKAGDRENEVLVSSENPAVILDALGKSVGTAAESEPVIIFDSLSDIVLSLGFKESYKFLKAALEICANKKTISIFVMLSGSHEESVENAIVGRFPIILEADSTGVRVVKSPF